MGDTLFGTEVSGTPLETRGATRRIGRDIAAGRDPLGGIRSSIAREVLGFDIESIGGEEAARAALADPTDRTRGLFRSLRPFEERETSRQVSGLRNMFGTVGGRFSRNLASAEGRLRGELADQFRRSREESLLEAGALRNQALAQLLGIQSQAATRGASDIMRFVQPGRPNFREGIAGDLLSAGGTLAGMALFPPAGAAAAIPSGAMMIPRTRAPDLSGVDFDF